MLKLLVFIWAIIAALAIAGCALTPEAQAEREQAQARDARQAVTGECIRTRQIRSFRTLDRQNLMIESRGNAPSYHIELSSPCGGLGFRHNIVLDTVGGSFCGHGGSIRVQSNMMVEHCHVRRMRRLDEAGVHELLARFDMQRGGEPAAGQADVELPDVAAVTPTER